jgi:hypothetical protein
MNPLIKINEIRFWMMAEATPVSPLSVIVGCMASSCVFSICLYAGTIYGPDTQYAHLINQNTIQYRTWRDRIIIATPRYGSAAEEEGVAGVAIAVAVASFSIIVSSLMNNLSSRRAEDAGEPLLLLLIWRSSAGTMNVSTSFQLITIDARTVNNVSKNADGVDDKDDSNDIMDTEAADDAVSELPMKV